MISYDQVVETVHIDSAKELFDLLSPFEDRYKLLNNGFIFRGEATKKYSLLPTALRVGGIGNLKSVAGIDSSISNDNSTEFEQRLFEYRILHKFFVKADRSGMRIPNVDYLRKSMAIYVSGLELIHNEWLPDSLHELAALAQHYGLPTRLLDWSLDPFVSLYFASMNALKDGYDQEDHMVLWAMNHHKIEEINLTKGKVPLTIINPPYGGNENLKAQQGILTYWKCDRVRSDQGIMTSIKTDRTPLDILLHEDLAKNEQFKRRPFVAIYKFLIPCHESVNLFFALQRLNYDAAKLFPGFDGISKSITELTLLNNHQ